MEGIICSDLGFISRVYIQSYLNCCFMSEDFGPLLVSMTKRKNFQLLIVELATTVENPEMIIATAVFEYFPAQIAVAGTGFTGFYCHQTTEVR